MKDRGRAIVLDEQEREMRAELARHVEILAGVIGPRSLERPTSLEAAASYVERELRSYGYETRDQWYEVSGQRVWNIDCECRGSGAGVYVVGAHYDTVPSTPGADDNASAVAGLLVMARRLAAARLLSGVRFVAFVNEEPPYFYTQDMGSRVYARACRERGEAIRGMICLEMIGCYSREPGSQSYPEGIPSALRWMLPTRGDFIAIVGNLRSAGLVRRCRRHFQKTVRFPLRAVALPERVGGIGLSDHWSFWQEGYEAVMVTDTSMYRCAHYHTPRDTPDTLDYDAMARVVKGLAGMVEGLGMET